MKKITDETIVKVKVPKHLYESIKKRLALKEAQEPEEKAKEAEPEEEEPKYAGTKMSKSDVLDKVGKGKQRRKITGDKAKAYQPPHSRVYKEDEQIGEAAVDYAWVPAAAAALGIAGSMLKNMVSYMKKNKLSGIGGLMQAYKQVGSGTASGIDRSMGTQA